MRDISNKYSTLRTAAAAGSVRMPPAFIRLIAENRVEKGNVLETARVAATMAAKKLRNSFRIATRSRLTI